MFFVPFVIFYFVQNVFFFVPFAIFHCFPNVVSFIPFVFLLSRMHFLFCPNSSLLVLSRGFFVCLGTPPGLGGPGLGVPGVRV